MRNGTEISRPRGRPRSFDRDAALRAAAQRFRTHGFAATSLDELAEATGLARPSLYAAFGDKRALYLEALARTRAWLAQAFASVREADHPLPEMLKAVFAGAIDAYLSGERGPSGCIILSTATAAAVTDPDIRAALAETLAFEDAEIEALLTRAGSPAPGIHARLVASALHSLSIRARAGEPRAALQAIAKECSALVIATSAPLSDDPPREGQE